MLTFYRPCMIYAVQCIETSVKQCVSNTNSKLPKHQIKTVHCVVCLTGSYTIPERNKIVLLSFHKKGLFLNRHVSLISSSHFERRDNSYTCTSSTKAPFVYSSQLGFFFFIFYFFLISNLYEHK